MRKISAFYAWQSDTPQEFNRHLIEIALQEAATRINEDSTSGVQVEIDSDTKGVPGTPPITETILKKIDACDLFVPDLTFVARTANGKYVPNPNVMAEFGYALHARTYAALMPIMNTAFGPAEKLPFDLGHLRHPIQYGVESTAGTLNVGGSEENSPGKSKKDYGCKSPQDSPHCLRDSPTSE